jgi:predicted DsbA family dithiol-disulfide isomerase
MYMSSYNEPSFSHTLWQLVPSLTKIAAVVLLIVNGMLFANAFVDSANTNSSYKFEPKLVRSTNYTTGKQDSKVTYVYFVDFQCPACKSNNEPFKALKEEYKDKVRFVYKHNPLTQIHPNARQAAIAVQSSLEQNKFIELSDQIFANQNSIGPDSLDKYAATAGLDVSKWKANLTNKSTLDTVSADQNDLKNIFLPESSVSKQTKPIGEGAGTPTSVLMKDGEVKDWWTGGQDPAAIKTKLDDLLK